MENLLENLKAQAERTNAAHIKVRMFLENGGSYEIIYHAPNDCKGYGHK